MKVLFPTFLAKQKANAAKHEANEACYILGFLMDVQNAEKTKNPSRGTCFWTTCANALVAQTIPTRRITSYFPFIKTQRSMTKFILFQKCNGEPHGYSQTD